MIVDRSRALANSPWDFFTDQAPVAPQETLSQLIGILLKLTCWGQATGRDADTGGITKGKAVKQLPEELWAELKKILRAAYRGRQRRN